MQKTVKSQGEILRGEGGGGKWDEENLGGRENQVFEDVLFWKTDRGELCLTGWKNGCKRGGAYLSDLCKKERKKGATPHGKGPNSKNADGKGKKRESIG